MSTNRRTRNQPASRQAPRGSVPARQLPPTRPHREVQAAPEPDDYDDTYDSDEPAEPDVAQEIEAQGHYVTASLCDELVRIIPPAAWRQSWQRHLHAGRMDEFAGQVIHPDDLDLYYDLDPTNDEVGTFIADAAELAGESLGKSHGPARPSRRTRRR